MVTSVCADTRCKTVAAPFEALQPVGISSVKVQGVSLVRCTYRCSDSYLKHLLPRWQPPVSLSPSADVVAKAAGRLPDEPSCCGGGRCLVPCIELWSLAEGQQRMRTSVGAMHRQVAPHMSHTLVVASVRTVMLPKIPLSDYSV